MILPFLFLLVEGVYGQALGRVTVANLHEDRRPAPRGRAVMDGDPEHLGGPGCLPWVGVLIGAAVILASWWFGLLLAIGVGWTSNPAWGIAVGLALAAGGTVLGALIVWVMSRRRGR
jgi:predicted phage tail protein